MLVKRILAQNKQNPYVSIVLTDNQHIISGHNNNKRSTQKIEMENQMEVIDFIYIYIYIYMKIYILKIMFY